MVEVFVKLWRLPVATVITFSPEKLVRFGNNTFEFFFANNTFEFFFANNTFELFFAKATFEFFLSITLSSFSSFHS